MNDKFLTCVKLLVGDLPEYFTPDWFKTLWYKADFNQDSKFTFGAFDKIR